MHRIKKHKVLLMLVVSIACLTSFKTLGSSPNELSLLMEQKRCKIVVASHGSLFYLNSKGEYTSVFDENDREKDRLNYPTFSPDGNQIAYCRYEGRDNYLIIFNCVDKTKKILYKNQLGIQHIAWSPDGNKILFLADYRYASETFDLTVIDVTTGNVRVIANNMVNAVHVCTPSWFFNSEKIIFSGINGKLIEVNVKNTSLKELTDGVCPSYSPNGKYIVYRSGKHEYVKEKDETRYIMRGFKYYLYNIKKEERKFLFNGMKFLGLGAEVWQSVIWSPDSRYIMFFETYDVPYVEKIYLMNISSKEKHLFAKVAPFSAGAISWIYSK